jgi:hypothetical protein
MLRRVVFNYREVRCRQVANRTAMFIGDCDVERAIGAVERILGIIA